MSQFRQIAAAGDGGRLPVHYQNGADSVESRLPPKPSRRRRHNSHYHTSSPPATTLAACAVAGTLVGVLLLVFYIRLPQHQGQKTALNSDRPEELRFGNNTFEDIGRDSRYWDLDDQRRGQNYGEVVSSRVRELDDVKRVEDGVSSKSVGNDPIDEYDDEVDLHDDNYDHVDSRNQDDVGIDKSADLKDGSDGNSSNAGVGGNEKDGLWEDSGATDSEIIKGKPYNVYQSDKKKKKPRRYLTCDVKFLNSTAQLVEPPVNKKFARFSLQYTSQEDNSGRSEDWEPRFAGHQTLEEREDSFYAKNQKINCGFVKGPNFSSTGFDIAEDDLRYMQSCHIAVSSCIFGNSDRLRTPFGKTITRFSRKHVCFVMFLDEITLETLSAEGQRLDDMGFIGLWKIILVKNMPSTDMRRVGKIPKFLAHRLFPFSRYSIWLDSKLRLQQDPLLILEYFLWRRGYEYAISNHYDRHCVWEEVAQNKKLNKFNHTVIDQQFEFYKSDGLIKFNPSDPNKILPSYVPEGSFIVREHSPMSNLFSCLWFNEVDRFTPRDQLSFAYTYLKLRRMNPGKPFYLNMFKDCERRAIAKLFHHRAEEKHGHPSR